MDIDNLFNKAIAEKYRKKLSIEFEISKINEFCKSSYNFYKENECYPVFNIEDIKEYFNDKDIGKSPYVLSSSLYLYLKNIGVKIKKMRYQEKVKIIIDEEKLIPYIKSID